MCAQTQHAQARCWLSGRGICGGCGPGCMPAIQSMISMPTRTHAHTCACVIVHSVPSDTEQCFTQRCHTAFADRWRPTTSELTSFPQTCKHGCKSYAAAVAIRSFEIMTQPLGSRESPKKIKPRAHPSRMCAMTSYQL